MKNLIAAWFRYSRAERIGLAVLSLIFLCLIAVRMTMQYWVKPPTADLIASQKLQLEYDEWRKQIQAEQPGQNTLLATTKAESFFFDPNTLDSAGFIRLGMPQRAVHGLMNWRRKGKHFYKAEDLKPLYNLPLEVYARLEPFIRIETTGRMEGQRNWVANQEPKELDLNSADSASLDRYVSGIGPVLAHKIVERRKALGGFLNHEQLLEVYKFPDSTFQKMKQKLRIQPTAIHKINLNSADQTQLAAHPYIGDKLAKYILLYRDGIGGFRQIEQIRQAPLMNEEIYRKIAPYLTVEKGPQNGSEQASDFGSDKD